MSLRKEIAECLEAGGAGEGKEAAGSAPAPKSPHPDADELIAYRAGTLGKEEARSVQEHLLDCPRCIEDLLDLEAFAEAGAGHESRRDETTGAAAVADLGAAATWRAVQKVRRRPRVPRRSIAAAMVAVTLGVGWWGAQQRAVVRQLRAEAARSASPVADAPIFDLSASAARGGDGGAATLVLPPGAGIVTLVVHVPGAEGLEALEAVLEAPGGERAWDGRLRISGYGTLRLGLHRAFLQEGRYRLEVYAAVGEERRPLESFSFDVALASVDG